MPRVYGRRRTDALAAATADGTPGPPLIVVGTEPVAQADGTVWYLIRPYPAEGPSARWWACGMLGA